MKNIIYIQFKDEADDQKISEFFDKIIMEEKELFHRSLYFNLNNCNNNNNNNNNNDNICEIKNSWYNKENKIWKAIYYSRNKNNEILKELFDNEKDIIQSIENYFKESPTLKVTSFFIDKNYNKENTYEDINIDNISIEDLENIYQSLKNDKNHKMRNELPRIFIDKLDAETSDDYLNWLFQDMMEYDEYYWDWKFDKLWNFFLDMKEEVHIELIKLLKNKGQSFKNYIKENMFNNKEIIK